MLNDGWDENMTTAESDSARDETYRDSHPVCLSCEQPGCLPDECPSGSCDVTPLVKHDGELIHADCVAAWDKHIANKCDWTTCLCPSDAVPVLLADDDEEETTPVKPLTNAEIAKLDPLGVFSKEAA